MTLAIALITAGLPFAAMYLILDDGNFTFRDCKTRNIISHVRSFCNRLDDDGAVGKTIKYMGKLP